jgi:hypothetical protein
MEKRMDKRPLPLYRLFEHVSSDALSRKDLGLSLISEVAAAEFYYTWARSARFSPSGMAVGGASTQENRSPVE